MNGIRRRRREHDIARPDGGQRQVRDPFLRTDRDDRLGLGIQVHIIVALVPTGNRMTQFRDAARSRIAMILGFLGCLDQFVDDMGRGGLIWIAHPEVDNILPVDAPQVSGFVLGQIRTEEVV